MDKPKILVVDDERMVCDVMVRVLHAVMECEVAKASNGVSALKMMEQEKYDIVISDMSMPEMDGADLLKTVHELYPDTVRLIFSARAGGNSALRAVGATHQYFLKPISPTVLGERIASMLQFQRMLPAEGVENVISKVGALPSIPEVYADLDAELKHEGEASAERVGAILEKDLSMSAKILQLVNSAFFGLRETVVKPSQAVALLGINIVKSLFLGLNVFEKMNFDIPGFSPQQLWRHSMNTASAAMNIAENMGLKQETAGEMYCAGLFHDIGKLVIAGNLPESLIQISRLVEKGHAWTEAEHAILGASHAEVGAYLMALWGFPVNVVKALAFHHEPAKSKVSGFSSVLAVHIANHFCRDGCPENDLAPLDMEYIKEQGMSEKLRAWKPILEV